MLKLNVNAEFEVFARYGGFVAGAPLIFSLNLAEGIANQNFLAFFSAQKLFIAFFHSQVAGVVTSRIVGIIVNILLRHLAYVAEEVGPAMIVVFTQYSFLYEKSRIAIHFFLKASIILGREVRHKHLRRIG